jgi:ubiquinone/menaquinone biosynthesis C-methylase UbiE
MLTSKQMAKTFTRHQARRYYNCLGSKLDTQAFYEKAGLNELCAHAQFEQAQAVFEFGCGTGRLAEDLFRNYLCIQAHYRAVDISPRMVDITRERLFPWRDRAIVEVSDGSMLLPLPDNSFDRFVSSYVIDLLSAADTKQLLSEAHRILMPNGLLCLVSITSGTTGLSRLIMRTWQGLGKIHPLLVGGCRPITLKPLLPNDNWQLEHHRVLTRYGVAIEVVIASARPIVTLP